MAREKFDRTKTLRNVREGSLFSYDFHSTSHLVEYFLALKAGCSPMDCSVARYNLIQGYGEETMPTEQIQNLKLIRAYLDTLDLPEITPRVFERFDYSSGYTTNKTQIRKLDLPRPNKYGEFIKNILGTKLRTVNIFLRGRWVNQHKGSYFLPLIFYVGDTLKDAFDKNLLAVDGSKRSWAVLVDTRFLRRRNVEYVSLDELKELPLEIKKEFMHEYVKFDVHERKKIYKVL